jgi:hypothetical protein
VWRPYGRGRALFIAGRLQAHYGPSYLEEGLFHVYGGSKYHFEIVLDEETAIAVCLEVAGIPGGV